MNLRSDTLNSMSKINCQKELVGNDVWVACSGGVDSIVVAHYIRCKLKRDVKLFHFNHALRSQNWEMEKAVKRFAEAFGMPIEIRRAIWDPTELVKTPRENELRIKRLEALVEVVQGSSVIYGHHLNDCVESYLMNTFNGIGERIPIPIATEIDGALVLRPFMLTPKKAFERYADAYCLNDFIVKDETNSDTKYRRNWVRNELIPMVDQTYPGLEKVVFKKMVDYYHGLGDPRDNKTKAETIINWLKENEI